MALLVGTGWPSPGQRVVQDIICLVAMVFLTFTSVNCLVAAFLEFGSRLDKIGASFGHHLVMTWVLARTTSGMMAASATRKFSMPCTRHHCSTTAIESDAGPILQVPDT